MRIAAIAFVGFASFVTLANVVCALQAHMTRRPGRASQVFMASFVLWLGAASVVFHAYGPRAAALSVAMAFLSEGLAWCLPIALGLWVSWRAERLEGSNLSAANLQGRSLRGARLRGARLSRANLQQADLRDADLTDADLEGANLRGALLLGANLDRANLRDADLRESVIYRTSYEGVRTNEGTRWPDSMYPQDIPRPSQSGN